MSVKQQHQQEPLERNLAIATDCLFNRTVRLAQSSAQRRDHLLIGNSQPLSLYLTSYPHLLPGFKMLVSIWKIESTLKESIFDLMFLFLTSIGSKD